MPVDKHMSHKKWNLEREFYICTNRGKKGTKYYATIWKENVVHELNYPDTPKLAARAYDAKGLSIISKKRLRTSLIAVIPCGARHDFIEKFGVSLDATITFECTLMKMLMDQSFNCLVTNEPNRTYFGCPGWTTLATAYEMEARERATFYRDYDHDEIMVYYRTLGSYDDGPLTEDYDPHATVEISCWLASRHACMAYLMLLPPHV
ncbi:hypothetical protein D1007_05722 [Hordeum vulgare]|nr:hypothetical protein D1007_05722 [Hordeum vulgare]